MEKYRMNINFLGAVLGQMLSQPGVSRAFHWFKKGAPPGIADSIFAAKNVGKFIIVYHLYRCYRIKL